ncbi:MAG: GAF domain-containing protein, partial [Rhizobiaceae bacterium]
MRDETGTADLENDRPGYRHEAATREILSAIHNSRDDETPVFDVVLRNAAQLCEAPLASLLLLNDGGDRLVLRAMWGEPLKHFKIDEHGVSLDSATNPAKAVRESRTSHIEDMANSEAYRLNDPVRRTVVDKDGIRSMLSVPLLKDGRAIGCIDLFRRELSPFSKRHIELVEGFAQQAVIAIDNVQQFHEIQTANSELNLRLDREAATRDILETIARSRGDEQPVFEVILRHACHLCEAQFSSLMMTNEERTHTSLRRRFGQEVAAQAATEWALDSNHVHSEAVRLGEVVHEVDLKESELYAAGDPTRVFLVDDIGCRSTLAVPLLKNKTAIGAIVLHRLDEARAFSDSEIQLMQSFATQAVIAIENVQQFKALESWNAELGDRVEEQVGEIERMSKLKRFLPAAVAD